MLEKIKNILRNNKAQIILIVITFLIGYLLGCGSIGIPNNAKIIALGIAYLPFILILILTLLSIKFKTTKKIFEIITCIIASILWLYYFIAIFICGFIYAFNPVTNIKYYKQYFNGAYLREVFPKEIPKNAEKAEFYYAPGILQGGTYYTLYYIDTSLTKEEFDKKYKEKAKWIGYIDEQPEDLETLPSDFSNTPAEEREEDFLI